MCVFACVQVLSELFSSVFERDDLPTPLHPLQGGATSRLIKPPALFSSLSTFTPRPVCSAKVGRQMHSASNSSEISALTRIHTLTARICLDEYSLSVTSEELKQSFTKWPIVVLAMYVSHTHRHTEHLVCSPHEVRLGTGIHTNAYAIQIHPRPNLDQPSFFSLQESELNVSKAPPSCSTIPSHLSLSPGGNSSGGGDRGGDGEEGSSKSLLSVLAALPAPPGGLKRRYSGEETSGAFCPRSKIPKAGK